MNLALLLPFSPTDPANSGVARLEMFQSFPETKFKRFHFGQAAPDDISVGTYAPQGSPRNIGNLIRLWRAFGKAHKEQPFDAIWTTLPPIMMALFARVIAWRYKLPLIVDVRDPGIASVVIVSPPHSRTFRIAAALERWIYKGATAVCVTTPELAQLLNSTFGVPLEKCTVISNAAVEKVTAKKKLDPKNISVFYAGTFAPYQLIDPLVDSLIAQPPDSAIHFHLYGYQPEKNPNLAERIAAAGMDKQIVLHPRIARTELFTKIQESDIVLVPIALPEYAELYDYAVPLKLYEALAFSKPVLLYGGTAASQRLVREHGFGVIAPINRPLTEPLATLMQGYAGFQEAAAKTIYSRSIEGKKLHELISGILQV